MHCGGKTAEGFIRIWCPANLFSVFLPQMKQQSFLQIKRQTNRQDQSYNAVIYTCSNMIDKTVLWTVWHSQQAINKNSPTVSCYSLLWLHWNRPPTCITQDTPWQSIVQPKTHCYTYMNTTDVYMCLTLCSYSGKMVLFVCIICTSLMHIMHTNKTASSTVPANHCHNTGDSLWHKIYILIDHYYYHSPFSTGAFSWVSGRVSG